MEDKVTIIQTSDTSEGTTIKLAPDVAYIEAHFEDSHISRVTVKITITQEEKAKRYDEAIKKAKSKIKNDKDHVLYEDDIIEIFPKLKESEDENIRKEIISALKYANHKGVYDKHLAWLEKQGEKDSKNTSIWHHWKDGIAGNGNGEPIYLIKSSNTYNLSSCLCFECDYILLSDLDKLMLPQKQSEQKPADKVEPRFKVGDKIQYLKCCGTIMTIEKIENGEYIFDNNMGHTTIESGNKWYLVEQNPAWSEDSEKILKEVMSNYESAYLPPVLERERILKELKSLKDRIQPQPKQEWSEEDEKNLQGIIDEIEANKNQAPDYDIATYDRFLYWLKSLRPQSMWKPSDAHYELEEFAKIVRDNLTGINKAVQELFEAKYLQLTGNKMYGGCKD